MQNQTNHSSLTDKNAGQGAEPFWKKASGKKAQGAIEYLLVIGAVIIVVAVVIIALSGTLTEANKSVDKNEVTTTNDPLKENLADSMGKYYIPKGAIENYKYTGSETTIQAITNNGENVKICLLKNCDELIIIKNGYIITIEGTPNDGTILKKNLEPTTLTQNETITYTQTLTSNPRDSYKTHYIYLELETHITLDTLFSNAQDGMSMSITKVSPKYYSETYYRTNGTWVKNNWDPADLTQIFVNRIDAISYGYNDGREYTIPLTGTLPAENSFYYNPHTQYREEIFIQLVKNYNCLNIQDIFNDLNSSKTITNKNDWSLFVKQNETQMGTSCFFEDFGEEGIFEDCQTYQSPNPSTPLNQFGIINVNYKGITIPGDIETYFDCS